MSFTKEIESKVTASTINSTNVRSIIHQAEDKAMRKEIIEFKNWHQTYSSSQESPVRVILDHILAGDLFSRHAIARCGQFFAAALLAGGLYLTTFWSGGGVWLPVALAATSAFVYIGLAMQCRTGAQALLNLLAAPIIFATAYAGMSVGTGWLVISFILHGSVAAVQLSAIDKGLRGFLLFWSAFNSAMALFLMFS